MSYLITNDNTHGLSIFKAKLCCLLPSLFLLFVLVIQQALLFSFPLLLLLLTLLSCFYIFNSVYISYLITNVNTHGLLIFPLIGLLDEIPTNCQFESVVEEE